MRTDDILVDILRREGGYVGGCIPFRGRQWLNFAEFTADIAV